MSPLRKFCFVLSLLQCVLFIVAFGWLIPCKIPRNDQTDHYSQNWELSFSDEDIVTNLAVTDITRKPVAVLLGFSSPKNGSVYGIRAVNAFDGSVIWETNVISKPLNIVCNSNDVNSDSIPYCIVTVDIGNLLAIDVKNGEIIWFMHEHKDDATIESQTRIQPEAVSTPVVGKSCHGVSVPSIYTAIRDKSGSYYFLVISGQDGRIEQVHKLPECAGLLENLMWQVFHLDDPDEIEPSLDLVMSCANEARNGIIYTVNANELCKNDTSRKFNEMFFKMGIVNGSKYPVSIKILKTEKGDNLAALTNDGHIHVYSEDKEAEVQFSPDAGQKVKSFTVGHFTNSSLANIAILSRSKSDTQSLMLLDNTNSHSFWSAPVENGTVVSTLTVRNGLGSLDTVLIKTVSEVTDLEHLNLTEQSKDLKHFEEAFLILECFDTGAFRAVTSDLTFAMCPKNACNVDLMENIHSAILADVDSDEKEELIYLSHNLDPSSLVHSVTLKLVRISGPGKPQSCQACNC